MPPPTGIKKSLRTGRVFGICVKRGRGGLGVRGGVINSATLHSERCHTGKMRIVGDKKGVA
jgi:hypothetical protein